MPLKKRSIREHLKRIGREAKQNLLIYKGVLNDPRTPKPAKFLLWLAVGYLLLPFDLIPDFIPVIGHLDDAIIVPFLIFLAIKITPKQIFDDWRQKIIE